MWLESCQDGEDEGVEGDGDGGPCGDADEEAFDHGVVVGVGDDAEVLGGAVGGEHGDEAEQSEEEADPEREPGGGQQGGDGGLALSL